MNKLSNIKNKKSVNEIFSDVSNSYDYMNDILSFGLHRVWKKQFVNLVKFKKNNRILDLAGGSGDIAKLITDSNPEIKKIFVSDINKKMLTKAQQKLSHTNIKILCHRAEQIPFKSEQLDFVLVAFGVRNFDSIELSLGEIYRVLKKNGKFMCLEFSSLNRKSLRLFFKFYCGIIPLMGKYFAKNEFAYKYLVESIEAFPNQIIFSKILKQAGFKNIECFDLLDGIASIHIGEKV